MPTIPSRARRMLVLPVLCAITADGLARAEPPVREPPAREALAERNRERLQLDRALKKLRFKHFGDKGNIELRQDGLAQLRTFTNPLCFQSLVEVMQGEREDVREVVFEIFTNAGENGAAALAWGSIHASDAGFRDAARSRLVAQIGTGPVPPAVERVVVNAVESEREGPLANGAITANALNLFTVIPRLVVAQQGPPDQGRRGPLAYIAIGRQQAYVSDLTPVVAEGAVGFDPEISVLNTGTLLEVQDAVVTTVRTEVHISLIGLSSRLGGFDTRPLGMNGPLWDRWLREVYEPRLAEIRTARTTPSGGG